MGILSERVVPELQALVVSTLGLSSDAIVTRATKFVRFDWRELLEYFQQNVSGQGTKPPWCILRLGPEEPADWGMAVNAFTVPIEIFFIEDERDIVGTTCTEATTDETQTLASVAGIFVGQRLLWQTNQIFGIVQSIDTLNSAVTFDVNINSHINEIVSSDISSDVHCKMELLRSALYRGTSGFTTFQIVEDPLIDVSDINPANETHLHDNFSLLAGSVYLKILVGDY